MVHELPVAARRDLEELMATGTYEYQSDFARRYFSQGKAEGKAEDVLVVLDARGVVVSDGARARITSCTDRQVLDAWVRRAVTADTIDDLFTD